MFVCTCFKISTIKFILNERVDLKLLRKNNILTLSLITYILDLASKNKYKYMIMVH